MELTGNEQTFVFSKRIEFELNGSPEFVELREFNMQEMKDFQRTMSNGQIDAVEAMGKAETFFPGCLIASSFTVNGTPATGKQIYEVLKKSSSLFMAILEKWMSKEEDHPFFSLKDKQEK